MIPACDNSHKEGKMAYVRGIARNQMILFPEALDDYIEEDNPVQFIDVFVDSLDLQELGFKYADLKGTGRPPYNPGDMLKLYLYGYLNRIRTSRRLEKECRRNVEVMWLIKKLVPDFKTIANFRKDNGRAIKQGCKEFTLLCKKFELFGGELVAIDSSKFRASNAKKRNFNEPKLKKAIKQIEEKIEDYLRELDEGDQEEAHLERTGAEDLRKKIDLFRERGGRYHGLLKELEESEDTQVSLTDPDSRAMVNDHRLEISYSVQTAVDSKHKLILDHEVTHEASDSHQLSEMAIRAKDLLGTEALQVVADRGYYNADEIKQCVDEGITPYLQETASNKPKGELGPGADFGKDRFLYNAERDLYVCPQGSELTFRGEFVHAGRRIKRSEEQTSEIQ